MDQHTTRNANYHLSKGLEPCPGGSHQCERVDTSLCPAASKPIALRTWAAVAGMDGVRSSLGSVYRMGEQGAATTPRINVG